MTPTQQPVAADLTDDRIMEIAEGWGMRHAPATAKGFARELFAALGSAPATPDKDGQRYRWLRDSDCIHPATDRVPEHRLEIFRIKGDDFLRNGCAVSDYDDDIDFCMAADKEWRDPGPASAPATQDKGEGA